MKKISLGALAVGLAMGLSAPAWAIKGVDFPSHTLDEINQTIDSGDYAAALPMVEEFLRFEPNDAEVHNLLGYTQRNLGELDAAMAAYTKALEINPDHKGTLSYQGELFLKLKDTASAEKNLGRLKVLCPGGCEAHDVLQAAIERSKDGEFAWTGRRVTSN
jgi:tetratricopeptide (TPR) repeat protein